MACLYVDRVLDVARKMVDGRECLWHSWNKNIRWMQTKDEKVLKIRQYAKVNIKESK